MPRDIPVGNGTLLIAYDERYQIRDLYFPHVGQENHAGGEPWRFGVFAEDVDGNSRIAWTQDPEWEIHLDYKEDSLTTDVRMVHVDLGVELLCQDVVDFNRLILVRRIRVRNLFPVSRQIRVFSHHHPLIYGSKVGDTAFFDPHFRSLVHYRSNRYILCSFHHRGEYRMDGYATGTAGFGGAEGTWRDAEDGKLGGNPIAQGSIDSTMMLSLSLPPNGEDTAHLVMAFGQSYADLKTCWHFLHTHGPEGILHRTDAYWRLWLDAGRMPSCLSSGDAKLSPDVLNLYRRSLLVVRTQVDSDGAILAANDSDYLLFSRDTYSYMWPRDGAFVVDALDEAGFSDLARNFFRFCERSITHWGAFLHKYNPDGTPGSSWHPWLDAQGRPQMPIQEDETALVLWSLWRHYERHRDIEFVRFQYVKLIQPAADFLVQFRDPDTHLPLPSYDLWEERFGVHAFTVATVYAGLEAAGYFAVAFGDTDRAEKYSRAAREVREAFKEYFWDEELGRYVRRIELTDVDRISEFMAQIIAEVPPGSDTQDPLGELPHVFHSSYVLPNAPKPEFSVDKVPDASMFAITVLGLLSPEDQRAQATINAIESELTVQTPVGGMARYVNDYYHRVSRDIERIPGNPWFICTLWMALCHIQRATCLEDLKPAREYLDWVAKRCLPSGVLAEQVHPETNEPLSVSPLTWSHATVISTVLAYADKVEALAQGKPCDPLTCTGLPAKE